MSAKKATKKKDTKKVTEKTAKKAVAKTAKKVAKKTTQRGTKKEPDPYRKSVASLAAQIVSAQVAGIAQHETLSAIWVNLSSALTSFAGVLDQENTTGDEPGQSPTQYRAAIASIRQVIPQPDVLRPIGHADLNALTESALRYAETLLSPHETEEQIIFAEQMFSVEEKLAVNGIHSRFRDFGWNNLMGTGTFLPMIENIDSWYAAWLQDDSQEPQPARSEPSALSILAKATRILDKQSPASTLSNEASEALKRVIRSQEGIPITQIPRRQIRTGDHELLDWLYCDEEPEKRSANRSIDSKKKSKERQYRPWGLFRYLRLYGDNDAAKSLNNKLKCPKSILTRDHFPEALYPDQYGMQAIEQIVNGTNR